MTSPQILRLVDIVPVLAATAARSVGCTPDAVLVQTGAEWLLLDRGEDERVVERFTRAVGLLEVASLATAYLEQAEAVGAPCATEVMPER